MVRQANAEEFIHVFVGQEEWLAKFLEFIVQQGLATNLVYNTLLEIYLRDDVRGTFEASRYNSACLTNHVGNVCRLVTRLRPRPGRSV
jgi:hypothetical protein